jgi:2-phospho-L-lactate guanylyltransferase
VISWIVVVPVKGTPAAKSRFGGDAAHRAALAEAMALDTVEAVLAAPNVSRVIVVTSSEAAPRFAALGARVVVDTGGGLNAAVDVGLAEALGLVGGARAQFHTAVLLGDLPALKPPELEAALALATAHDRTLVADAAGSGTTLITALYGRSHAPAFGAGSAQSHRAAGYTPLDIPVNSGLRLDVDTSDELAALDAARLGPRTAAAL